MKKYVLPKLPYLPIEVADIFSEKQLQCHYYLHHQKYIDQMNVYLQSSNIEFESMVSYLREDDSGDLFNQIAQSWNHTLFWNSISAKQEQPGPKTESLIAKSGYSLDSLMDKFKERGKKLFGSGWVWLVLNSKNHIEIMTTRNARNPLLFHFTPLLVADVWEHAYYLDYQSSRAEYLEKFCKKINWSWVENIVANKKRIHDVEALMTDQNLIVQQYNENINRGVENESC